MATLIQSEKGFQSFAFPDDLFYYTRIFDCRSSIFISPDYNGDVFLGAINRYHKIGQIFFLFEGYVVEQHFLEYTQQYWGTFIPRIDVDLPIFIEYDGLSLGEFDNPATKHLTPNTQYEPSEGIGKVNWMRYLLDFALGNASDLASYQLNTSMRQFAKYKPGLYSQMRVVDQIAVECFRNDVVIQIDINGIR